MNLLAHDADDGSLYKITVKKQELIQLLRTEYPDILGDDSNLELLGFIKSMTPEDIDGVILGTLQNQNLEKHIVSIPTIQPLKPTQKRQPNSPTQFLEQILTKTLSITTGKISLTII